MGNAPLTGHLLAKVAFPKKRKTPFFSLFFHFLSSSLDDNVVVVGLRLPCVLICLAFWLRYRNISLYLFIFYIIKIKDRKYISQDALACACTCTIIAGLQPLQQQDTPSKTLASKKLPYILNLSRHTALVMSTINKF